MQVPRTLWPPPLPVQLEVPPLGEAYIHPFLDAAWHFFLSPFHIPPDYCAQLDWMPTQERFHYKTWLTWLPSPTV